MLELEEGVRLEAAEYCRFREAVGWIPPPVHDVELQAALDGTWNVVAREHGELVGIGRLLDDGALYATIWDMIVLPGQQRHGVGRAILERLLARGVTAHDRRARGDALRPAALRGVRLPHRGQRQRRDAATAVPSSAATSASARPSRSRFAGTFSQPLAPEGCGSGTTAAPSRSKRSPTQAVSSVLPSRRRSASPPTVTISRGRSSASSQSRQNAHSSCSRGVGVRSPRPDGARPG